MFPPFCVLCVLERSGVGQELAQDWPRVRIWSLYPPYMLSILYAWLFFSDCGFLRCKAIVVFPLT